VTGNGLIPLPGSSPSLPTTILSLDLFLVSSDTGANLTVACSPTLLTQEPSSHIKHVDFLLPSCLPGGVYNLTYYETFRLNSQSFFAITPIPLIIDNPPLNNLSSRPCTRLGMNPLQLQPQPSNPSPVWPWSPTLNRTHSAIPFPLFSTPNSSAIITTLGTVTITWTLPGTTVFSTVVQTVTPNGTGKTMTTATLLVPVNDALSGYPFGRMGIEFVVPVILVYTMLGFFV